MKACQQPGVDPEWFFPARFDVVTTKRAKSICAVCPERRACYVDADRRNEHHGIWGGISFGGPRRRRVAQALVAGC